MMIGLDRHRKYVPESQKYYEKKRGEGNKHNQAIRALGRHLCRIIYKMLKEGREYEIRPEKGYKQSPFTTALPLEISSGMIRPE